MLGEAAIDGRRRGALLRRLRARDPRDRRGVGRARHLRGPGHLDQALGAASALQPRAARARAWPSCCRALQGAGACWRERYDIGLNIDAEEADRLELSLDLLEALCFEPELAGWNGIGFVVQAYQKRCPFVIDWLIDLARRSGRRLMVRLVKGAYWDSEIKRAQVDGLDGFPVFTRKVHTDVSYLACARKLLAAPDAVFPQFATHNAQTLAADLRHGRRRISIAGQYEFQCLHGMGEPLYEEVVGPRQARPAVPHLCAGRHARDAARLSRAPPAGERRQHLVRQPHRRSETCRSTTLMADPVERARRARSRSARRTPRSRCRATCSAPARPNSRGLDLADEQRLASLAARCRQRGQLAAAPLLGRRTRRRRDARSTQSRRPRDVVGTVVEATPEQVDAACAARAAPTGSDAAGERAAILRRAADLLEARMPR